MKNNLLMGLLIALLACKGKTSDSDIPDNLSSKKMEIKLRNHLGSIFVLVPARYDTLLSWIHYSDCGSPCDQAKYRLQSKQDTILKETSFFWTERKDSVDYITISHTMDTSGFFKKSNEHRGIYVSIQNNLIANNNGSKIILDTIIDINGRFFSVLAVERLDSIKMKKATAVTRIKNREIKFQYEILTKKEDQVFRDLIKDFFSFIESIKIIEE